SERELRSPEGTLTGSRPALLRRSHALPLLLRQRSAGTELPLVVDTARRAGPRASRALSQRRVGSDHEQRNPRLLQVRVRRRDGRMYVLRKREVDRDVSNAPALQPSGAGGDLLRRVVEQSIARRRAIASGRSDLRDRLANAASPSLL